MRGRIGEPLLSLVGETVDVLVPVVRRRSSVSFVRVYRTKRMPERIWSIGGLRYSSCARAVADAVRGESDLRAVTDLVARAVQRNACTVGQLAVEIRRGPKQGSSTLRVALSAAADGIASAAEADLRALIRRSGLPEPRYNASLYIGDELLAVADAWWADAGVAGEVDSREWHLSPAAWQATMARHALMSAHGIIVLHFPPSRIAADPARVVAELKSAISAGRRRPPLSVKTVPNHALAVPAP